MAEYKTNKEVQTALQEIEASIVKAIEEDFPPLKVTMFVEYDLDEKKNLLHGVVTLSNNVLYNFSVSPGGETTLTRILS
jgi:hypothetical protein